MWSDFFRNIRFKKKIMLVCLSVSLLPVLVLGIFCYYRIRILLIEREKVALANSLTQETNTLNARLDGYESIMRNIVYNEAITQALNRSYFSNYDMFIAYRDVLDPFFANLELLSDIESITIYSDNLDLYSHGHINRPITELDEEYYAPLLKDATRFLWDVSMENQTLEILGKISTYQKDALLIAKINLPYSSVFTPLSHLYEQAYGILLADSDGTVLYQYHSDDMEQHTLKPQQLFDAFSDPTNYANYIIEKRALSKNGWNLYLYRPAYTVTTPTLEIAQTVVVIVFFCLIYVFLFSSLLSNAIVRPLEGLTADVKRLEQGNFTTTISYQSRDEIGTLISHFKSMAQQMDLLVNEILKSKILRQKYEMQALKAQINPHFLYNTLSLINSKAILTGQKDIGEIAQSLSSFYRTTLNKGTDCISVRDELLNVKSYINIQLVMHSESFDVTYDVEEDCLSLMMINLLLQPLVENAILHGIDHIQGPERGCLTIIGKTDKDVLLFQISDNGPGIPSEKLASLLNASSSGGYGVKNVHARIRLFYGEQYGLSYQSMPGLGTTVTVTLPKCLSETENVTPSQRP